MTYRSSFVTPLDSLATMTLVPLVLFSSIPNNPESDTPLMIANPLKRERLELQLSPDQMASIANIQLAAIGQAEEGFYVNPLPSYLLALGITPGSPREKRITEEYREYQRLKRISNGPNGTPKLIANPQFSVETNPLYTWRTQSGLATYGFCSAFCIHMPLVNRFEKHISGFGVVPPPALGNPLIEAGYDLDEFKEACEVFKMSMNNKIRLANNLPPVGSLAG